MKKNYFAFFLIPLFVSFYGGETKEVMHIDRCDLMKVTVSADRIDSGEYVLEGCSRRYGNVWDCECHDDYSLLMTTHPKVVNTYEISAEYIDYHDMDGDGYDIREDCDDRNKDINPGAKEICDHRDNDCDSRVDELPCTAAAFCALHDLKKPAGDLRCLMADWQDNERRVFPLDCYPSYVRKGRQWIGTCKATGFAN